MRLLHLSCLCLLAASAALGCAHTSPKAEPEVAPAAASASLQQPELPPFPGTTAACAEGDAPACARLVQRVLSGVEPSEVAQYRPAFEAACEKRIADACAGLGVARSFNDGTEGEAAASRLFDDACGAGSSAGCALMLERKLRAEADQGAMGTLAQQTVEMCDRLGGSVCFTAATLFENGAGVPRDEARAKALTLRACDTGSAFACFVAGMNLAEGQAVPSAEARAAYEKACGSNIAGACFNLAYALLQGATAEEKEQGRALGLRACRLGDARACDFLAATNEGRSAPGAKDVYASPDAAQAANERYCELGGAEACVTVAFYKGARAEESGQLHELEKVLPLLQRGCVRGSVRGCNALAHVAADAVSSCEGGDAGQCLVAGYVFTEGVRVPRVSGRSIKPDADRAKAAFQKACEGGVQAACSRAGGSPQ